MAEIMKVTLLVLAWNEIDGMKAIMPRVKKEWVDQIVVLDGGSTDGTTEYARSQGYFVYIQKERGVRQGMMEVLPYIEGDVVITFSPDGNSIPELIPKLIEKMKEGYDMVIASRYLDGAKSEDDDPVTAFGNWLMTKIVNILFGGRYTDMIVIFRAHKKQLIHDLELDKNDGYRFAEKIVGMKIAWEPLLSIRAAKRRLKVIEIPGDEPARIGGKRKLKVIRYGLAYFIQFAREAFFWR